MPRGNVLRAIAEIQGTLGDHDQGRGPGHHLPLRCLPVCP